MACEIKIENVFGNSGGASYWVHGTISECATDVEGAQVIVGLSCTSADGPFNERSADVDSDGNWSVVIPNPGDCACGRQAFVIARCATDDSCRDALAVDETECVECPFIDFGDDVGAPFLKINCNPDGTASVSMSFVVQNTTSNLAYIIVDCGPGGTEESGGIFGFTPGSSGMVTVVCRYPTPFSPSPTIRFLNVDFEPLGCPPEPIPVPPLARCDEEDCPIIEDVIVTILECERDQDDGIMKRLVRFEPVLSGPDPDAHNWTFGDGDTELGGGAPGTVEHLYEGKPATTARLSISGPPPCETTDYDIPSNAFDDLDACACPAINGVSVTIGGCEEDPADGQLERKVTLTPSISGPSPAAHSWDFGDGNTAIGTGAPGPTDHYYGSAPNTAPELCIDGPDPCATICQSVSLSEFDTFEPCGDNGDGDGDCAWYDPTCWSVCGWLGGLLAILIAAYLVAIATGFTADISQSLSSLPGFPNDLSESVVIGSIGGILGALMALYGSFCGLCNLGKAMVGGAVLGVLIIIVLALFGVTLPHWVGAVITAVVLALTGWALIDRECD